jgi:Fe-S cluster biogenesis protein NfuA/nitrite reductase/ring-hydroxylating ferredoxin subunit
MSNSNGPSSHATNDDDLNREGQRIEKLVEKIQALEDAAARVMLQECLEAVLNFYGHGLGRILQVIEKTGPEGKKVQDALLHDGGISGLLLIHGLHPIPLEKRLSGALDKVRPYMQSHGGNVELLSLENDFALLKLEGHCKTCPSSAVTLELAVRNAIEEACPDLAGFEVEGMVGKGAHPAGESFEHNPKAAPEWTPLKNAGQLHDGGLMSVPTETEPLLVCRIEGQLYAYRDRCPGCNMPLHLGNLNATTLTCGMGHRFDVRHAGIGLDDTDLHLDPIPLLEQQGEIKVALTHHANGAGVPHLTETASL